MEAFVIYQIQISINKHFENDFVLSKIKLSPSALDVTVKLERTLVQKLKYENHLNFSGDKIHGDHGNQNAQTAKLLTSIPYFSLTF